MKRKLGWSVLALAVVLTVALRGTVQLDRLSNAGHESTLHQISATKTAYTIQPESIRVASSPPQDGLARIVEFRDGTMLRVTIPDQAVPWQTVSREGEITEQPVPFRTVRRLDLVTSPVTDQVAIVRRLIAELGSPIYKDRVAAHDQLIEIGGKYKSVIQAASATEDSEVRWRIDDIMENVTRSEESIQNDFDRLQLTTTGDTLDGDVGDWVLEADFQGIPISLDREKVLSIYEGEISLDFDGGANVASVERIAADDPGLFPANTVRLDFDRTPSGAALEVGQDVSDVYVDYGAAISTTYPDAIVAVQSYRVRSAQSAASEQGRNKYLGTIVVKFCVPGNERLAASVRYIGCWASYLTPEGTLLQAFDAQDNLIGQVESTLSGAEFLSLKSTVPIAYCKIVPVDDIDPDYAFDEFIFDAPRPLIESGDPALYSLVLKSGERVQGQTVVDEGDAIKLVDLTIGVDAVSFDKAQVAVLIPPADQAIAGISDEPRPFLQLRDGSTMRADYSPGEGLSYARFGQDVPIELDDLAALWSQEAEILAPSAEDLSGHAAVVMAAPGLNYQLSQVQLDSDWLRLNETDSGNNLDYSYANTPIIWFTEPPVRVANSGYLRTTDGEGFVLHPDGFQVTSWGADNLTLSYRESEIVIPIRQIVSLRFAINTD